MKSVLMICNPEDKKLALLDKACKMAQFYQAKLHVLDVVYVRDLTGLEELSKTKVEHFKTESVKQREAEIRAAMDAKKVDPRTSKIHVIWAKSPIPAALELCKTLDPTMVLKSASSANKRIFFTPSDWLLIQRCPSPLLISPLKAFRKQAKIMVALDLATKVKSKMALNHKLAATGKALADNMEAELHFACCVSVSAVLKELDMITPSAELRKLKLKAKPLLEEFQHDYEVSDKRVHFKVGSPAKVLNSISQDLKADCIILGTMGRKGLKARFLGSTTEQMLSHLHTDMLLIHP